MLKITKEELMRELHTFFTSEVESCPLNARAFCDVLFCKYQPERSKREDSIPEWGANAPMNYDEWVKRCGALNIVETQ